MKTINECDALPQPWKITMKSSNGSIFRIYWPFASGIHRSLVYSLHKGQWRGALMFSLICTWTNGRANDRNAGDLRRYRAHYDVTVMWTFTIRAWKEHGHWLCWFVSHGIQANTSKFQRMFMSELVSISLTGNTVWNTEHHDRWSHGLYPTY